VILSLKSVKKENPKSKNIKNYDRAKVPQMEPAVRFNSRDMSVLLLNINTVSFPRTNKETIPRTIAKV
jgi:hypothetical protein